MEEKTKNSAMEEQILNSISMSLYGRHLQSRCRVISPAQKAEMKEAAISAFMKDYQIDREKAEAMYNCSEI